MRQRQRAMLAILLGQARGAAHANCQLKINCTLICYDERQQGRRGRREWREKESSRNSCFAVDKLRRRLSQSLTTNGDQEIGQIKDSTCHFHSPIVLQQCKGVGGVAVGIAKGCLPQPVAIAPTENFTLATPQSTPTRRPQRKPQLATASHKL